MATWNLTDASDTFVGTDGTDTIYGRGGDDRLDGAAASDQVFGGDGNDSLLGGDGDDVLNGGAGRDILEGGTGNDRLVGGAGPDTFVFASGDGRDVIVDWANGDLIDLSGVAAARGIDQVRIEGNGSSSPTVYAGDVTIVVRQTSALPLPIVLDAAAFRFAANAAPLAVDDVLAAQLEDSGLRTIALTALTGNDRDDEGDPLSIAAVDNATGGSVAIVDGAIRFTAAADFSGTAGFDYTLSDGRGGTDVGRASFAVTPVNDAPVAVDDTLAAQAQGAGTRSITFGSLTSNDIEPDGDPKTVIAVNNAQEFMETRATGGTVLILGGRIHFTADANFSGTAGFDYTVSDRKGGFDVGHVSFQVNPANRSPVAADDTLAAQAEDSAPRTIAFAELTGNDRDPDGDALTVTAVSNATGGTVAIVDGAVRFTAAADFVGLAGFDYTVADGRGRTDVGRATFEVTPVYDAPVAVDDTLAAMAEDAAPRTITFASLTRNDGNPDGAALTVTEVGSAAGGTVAILGGAVRFTAAADFNGTAGFDYTIGDGLGGADVGRASFAVTPVNDDPVAADDVLAAQGQGSGPRSIAFAELTANDRDAEGDALSVFRVFSATGGDARIVGGQVVFTANPDFVGTAGFGYTVSDRIGGTDIARATLEVTAVNDAPVAEDDTLAAQAQNAGPRTIAFAELLGNDTDADGEALTVSDVANATGGTVTLQAGAVVFAADAGFSGEAGFDYTVVDGHGGSDTARVRIEVQPVELPDPVVLSLSGPGASQAEGNASVTAMSFTVTRSGDAATPASALWAVHPGDTDAADFASGLLPAGGVTFAANQSEATITVEVQGDTLVEGDETFQLVLSDPAGASLGVAAATGTIRNDDAAPAPEIVGTGADDVLLGTAGDDLIRGLRGNDDLRAGGGDDVVFGGDGDDVLLGDLGIDQLTGGAGKDLIVLRAIAEAPVGGPAYEEVLAFSRKQADAIDLRAIDANVDVDGDQAFALVGEAEPTGPGQLRIQDHDGDFLVTGHVDADPGADFALVVRTPLLQLVAADFLL